MTALVWKKQGEDVFEAHGHDEHDRHSPWELFRNITAVKFPADRIAELTAGIGKYLASLGEQS
jgi:hypothetical protein